MGIFYRECVSRISAALSLVTLGVAFSPLLPFRLAAENTASQSVQDTPATRTVPSDSTTLLRGRELPKVVSTYRESIVRFKSDFLGKPFFDVLPFLSAKKSAEGNYRIGFGTDGAQSDLDCKVTSPAEISKIANWNKGDEIHVAGLVKDVANGSVILDPCALSK
jgi:hypothetical protein